MRACLDFTLRLRSVSKPDTVANPVADADAKPRPDAISCANSFAYIGNQPLGYGLYSYGLYSYGLCSYGQYSYGLYSHGLYRCDP